MTPKDLISIELSLAAALSVVILRLASLVRVTWELPQVHAEVLGLVDRQDAELPRELVRLSFKNPYAEAALELLRADRTDPERRQLLDEAGEDIREEALRSARRGQTLDLFGIFLLSGLLVAATRIWSAGPLALGLATATLGVLLVTLAVRWLFTQRVQSALLALRDALGRRPSLSSLDQACSFCGQPVEPCELVVHLEDEAITIDATACTSCGKVVGTLPERS